MLRFSACFCMQQVSHILSREAIAKINKGLLYKWLGQVVSETYHHTSTRPTGAWAPVGKAGKGHIHRMSNMPVYMHKANWSVGSHWNGLPRPCWTGTHVPTNSHMPPRKRNTKCKVDSFWIPM